MNDYMKYLYVYAFLYKIGFFQGVVLPKKVIS